MIVITNTPKKLKTAAIRIADRTDIERVETHVAIALGASVQPLTRITPIISKDVINKIGLEIACDKKSEKVIAIISPVSIFYFTSQLFNTAN